MKTQQSPKLINNFPKNGENSNFTLKKPGRQHFTTVRHADATSLLLGSELLPATLFCTHSMLSGRRPHMTFSSISISVLNCRSFSLFFNLIMTQLLHLGKMPPGIVEHVLKLVLGICGLTSPPWWKTKSNIPAPEMREKIRMRPPPTLSQNSLKGPSQFSNAKKKK